jgi:aryl-alcohol dehydrogenase-like predicted oxidoreductase
MDTIVLGRTGLEVSVAGLGCGGHSRLGQATGATEDESVRLVQRALDQGVTYFDTARAYGTEEIVGRALVETGTTSRCRPRPIRRLGTVR